MLSFRVLLGLLKRFHKDHAPCELVFSIFSSGKDAHPRCADATLSSSAVRGIPTLWSSIDWVFIAYAFFELDQRLDMMLTHFWVLFHVDHDSFFPIDLPCSWMVKWSGTTLLSLLELLGCMPWDRFSAFCLAMLGLSPVSGRCLWCLGIERLAADLTFAPPVTLYLRVYVLFQAESLLESLLKEDKWLVLMSSKAQRTFRSCSWIVVLPVWVHSRIIYLNKARLFPESKITSMQRILQITIIIYY